MISMKCGTNCLSAVDWDSCLNRVFRFVDYACGVELVEFAPWMMYSIRSLLNFAFFFFFFLSFLLRNVT